MTNPDQTRSATGIGIIAIVIWSSSIACGRSAQESLGTFTAAALAYLISGTIGLASYFFYRTTFVGLKDYSPRFYIVCGSCFVAYILCLYLAIGLAPSRAQVVEVAAINGMWPCLTMTFSIVILKKRPRWWIIFGLVLALLGLLIILRTQYQTLQTQAPRSLAVYLLAIGAALTWPLYCNFNVRLGGQTPGNAVPIFLFTCGLCFLILCQIIPEKHHITTRSCLELLYLALVPGTIAYSFWDHAMRKGNMILVIAVSYLTPLLACLVSSLYLKQRPSWLLWLACLLIITAAVISRLAFTTAKPPLPPTPVTPKP